MRQGLGIDQSEHSTQLYNDQSLERTGMGHLEIPNGSTYDGSFDKGLPNGIGVMRFADSSRFEGELMQGWFHGYGVFSTIDGMKFEGEFR